MNRSGGALALTALLFLAPAAAQEADPEDSRARARTLIEAFEGYDEALGGELHFTVTLQGAKAIGKGSLTVARAPGDAVHAVYKADLKVEMAFGGTKATQAATALLGADLSVLSYAEEETAHDSGEVTRSTATLELAGERWVFTRSQGGRQKTFRFPLQGPNHQSLLCGLLLTRKLELTKPTVYRFSEIDWPDMPAEGEPDPMVTARDLVVTIPEAAAYIYRGKSVKAFRITAGAEGEDATNYVVDQGHSLLAFWPSGSPLRLIVGSKEEAGKDVSSKTPALDSKTPLGTCALYVRVLSKQAPLETLDEIFDYPALHASFKSQNKARWERVKPDEFPAEIKKRIEGSPPLTKEQAEQFLLVLEETITGDTAKVDAPNLPPFHLAKHADGWKLTRLP